ncbi:MAG: ribbon-helix-helix domain-containing protein [Polyangiaceae bacterium]
MSRKKVSTTIYVTPEQNERLKVLHDRTKVPVAVYIREGIDLVLRQYAHLLPGQLPLDVTPPPGAVSAAPAYAPAANTADSDETPALPLGDEAFGARAASGKK